MIPCLTSTVNQRAASSSTQRLVARAASTGSSFRGYSSRTKHSDSARPVGAAAVEVHPVHADVAAYYADYAGTSPVLTQSQAPQQQHVVEVHLETHYKASFGDQLAVVGSHTGWLTSAAVPMVCGGAEADIWSVVLSLPYGSDVEYKYVVLDEHGDVVRWQEGDNNKLCLRSSGLLMHITESWSHESREVHEIGVPVPSQQQQRQRAAGGSSGSKTPAAASPVLLQNNIACFTSSSSNSSGAAAVASIEAADSTANVVQQQKQQQQQVPPSINTSSSFNPQPELDPLSQDVANLLPLLQTELASALAALSSNSSGSTQQDSLALLDGLQHQLSPDLAPLPADLLVTSYYQNFADEADVAAALQLQAQLTAAAAAMASEAEAAAVPPQQQQQQQRLAPVDVFAIAKQAAIAPPSAAVPGSLAAAAAAAAAAASSAAALASAAPSSSSSKRLLVGSHGSTLAPGASEDEIAAALLSDDCEEACLCLVDAICSCMNCGDGSSTEPCATEHLYDEADQQQQQQQEGLLAAAAAAGATMAFDVPPAAAIDEQATPVEQLAAMQGFVPEPAAASANAAGSNADGLGNGCFAGVAGTADVRAEAFGGVNRALQQSADLLEGLLDPTHPLMLKADRELADAKRHMGHLLAA